MKRKRSGLSMLLMLVSSNTSIRFSVYAYKAMTFFMLYGFSCMLFIYFISCTFVLDFLKIIIVIFSGWVIYRTLYFCTSNECNLSGQLRWDTIFAFGPRGNRSNVIL